MKNKKYILLILKFIFAVIIVAILIKYIGWNELIITLKKGNPFYLIHISFLTILFLYIEAFKLWLLFRPFYKINIKAFILEDITSISLGIFTPGSIGETSIILLLKKYNVNVSHTIGIFTLNKLTTLVVYAVISVIALLFYDFPDIFKVIYCSAIISILIISFISVSSFSRKYIRALLDKFNLSKIISALDTWALLIRYNKMILVYNFILTFVKIIIMTYAVHYSIIMFYNNIDLIDVFFLQSISRIFSIIPVTFQNIGILEGIMIYFYSFVGITSSIIFCSGLIKRVVTIIICVIILLYRFVIRKMFINDENSINSIA